MSLKQFFIDLWTTFFPSPQNGIGPSMRTRVGNEGAVEQFENDDGRCILSIVRSGDHFRFVEEQEIYQPEDEHRAGYTSWQETYRSGVYETAADAKRDAELLIAWLRSKTLGQ